MSGRPDRCCHRRVDLRAPLALLAVAAGLGGAAPARAAQSDAVQWLPGDARQISRSSSASRDTAALEAIVAPRFSVTLGSELALLAWRARGFSLRAGALALFGLESRTRSQQLFPAPGGDSDLWRGVLGYELAVSFDSVAAAALGRHGALEGALGYYHESEHHTASNDPVGSGGADHPDLRGRPQIGNFLALDWAARLPLHSLELLLRQQSKLFINGVASQQAPFRAGAGEELVLQLHQVLPVAIPFWSTSAEVLIARGRAPARYFRSLLGVCLPGLRGELRLYASYDAGAGKGLLIPEQQRSFGAGVRYTPFTSGWP